MSDLISRSQLLKQIETWGGCVEALHDYIQIMPTAYDINKVVEELNKAKDELANENYCRSINEKEKCDGRNCFKCCAEYLIEIVKRGGVSDDACEWKDYKDGIEHSYHIGCCEEAFSQCYETNFKFCPYCGKKIKVVE